jgi:hypothetical protein
LFGLTTFLTRTDPEDHNDDGEALLQRSELASDFKPLDCARDRAKAKKAAHADEDDVEWLRSSASERFGRERFQRFQHSRNRVLQNADVLELWQYAVQFGEAYHKKKSGASVSFRSM